MGPDKEMNVKGLDKRDSLGNREFHRMRYPIPIRFGGERNRFQDSLMKDIGGGGVRLLSREFMPVDSKVKIEFFLTPASEALTAVGRVVWVTKVPYSSQHEVGIQFLDISEPNQNRIQRFVEQNASKVREIVPHETDIYRDTSYTIAI